MALLKNEQRMHWYVMRDLKRPNAKLPLFVKYRPFNIVTRKVAVIVSL